MQGKQIMKTPCVFLLNDIKKHIKKKLLIAENITFSLQYNILQV